MFRGSSNVVTFVILVAALIVLWITWPALPTVYSAWPMVIGIVVAASPRLINEWQRGVLLRLGKFRRVLHPGINWGSPGWTRS